LYDRIKSTRSFAENYSKNLDDELKEKDKHLEHWKQEVLGRIGSLENKPQKTTRTWSPVTLIVGVLLLIAIAVSFVSAATAQAMAAKIAEAQKKPLRWATVEFEIASADQPSTKFHKLA
jgi:hypothetical protein